jgi:membrane glycosyltransferase
MDSCGLPEFPGKAPLGGEILSHDFVEAAFILKQGWKVVVDHDLTGSYEECPSNLIDFARRDQRWCQGNLQHIRLVCRHGLRLVSRVQLGMGAMSYLSSPLWAAFLMLVVLMGLGAHGTRPGNSEGETLPLFMGTMLLLLLPKFWALVLALVSPARIDGFAGPAKATLSVILEIIVSILMAPILMVFHTTFVLMAFFGHSVQWEAQQRTDNRIALADAFRVHALHTIVGLSGTLLVTWLSPPMLPWLTPVLLPLVFSVPLSMLLGSLGVGARLLKRGFLVIPQEVRTPHILQRQRRFQRTRTAALQKAPHPFIRVVIVPAFNALHLALLPDNRQPADTERLNRLKRVALTGGPAHLTIDERKEIISDPAALRCRFGIGIHQRQKARKGFLTLFSPALRLRLIFIEHFAGFGIM